MDSEKRSQAYWEQVPHAELAHFGTDEKTTGDLKALQQFLKPTDHILDLGCGWGRITCALAWRGYQVTGLDLSENLITYARGYATASGLKIQFDVGSMLNLPNLLRNTYCVITLLEATLTQYVARSTQ